MATRDAAIATPVAEREGLPTRVKLGFGFGDLSINIQLASISIFFLFFLTDVAGLPPSLAGLVVLVGRAVDAVTDPLMGRISDATVWRWGRRRPYFLLGALPFAATFAALWQPMGDDPARAFVAYAAVYVLNTLSSTCVAVPYMALLPELAPSYQERTVTNMVRQVFAIAGVLATALGFQTLANALGGGSYGWSQAGLVFSIGVAVPWLVVYRVSWERRGYQRAPRLSFAAGLRLLARNVAYRRLVGLFLSARIALDVIGAMFIFFFTYWIGRPQDFSLHLGVLMVSAVASLPLWNVLSRRADKHVIFVWGASWWILIQIAMLFFGPDAPAWTGIALVVLAGFGYAVADLMPLSMLGDVIDADELFSGERREGLYAGFFTFLRKLGGATGVALAGFALELSGFVSGGAQPESAIWAIRGITALAPVLFLAIAIAIAVGYPIGRDRHREILAALEQRRAARTG